MWESPLLAKESFWDGSSCGASKKRSKSLLRCLMKACDNSFLVFPEHAGGLYVANLKKIGKRNRPLSLELKTHRKYFD